MIPQPPSDAPGPTRVYNALAYWAVIIHKSQGLTLNKVVVDIGKKEFCCGLTFVACSKVCLTPPFTFQQLASLSNSQRLLERQLEDQRLLIMQQASMITNTHPSRMPCA